MNKFTDVITSPRFIQLFIIAVLQSLVLFNVISSDQGTGLINIISALLGASVAIRTVDRSAEVRAGATTVNIPQNVSSVTASTTASKNGSTKSAVN